MTKIWELKNTDNIEDIVWWGWGSELRYALWEDITAWKACSLSYWTINQSVKDTFIPTWTTTNNIVSQKIFLEKNTTWNSVVKIYVWKTWEPQDNFIISIQWDIDWLPDWKDIFFTDAQASDIGSSTRFLYDMHLSQLELWKYYHIVFYRKWDYDNDNYYWVWGSATTTDLAPMLKYDWVSYSILQNNIYFPSNLTRSILTKWWINFIWILQNDWVAWEIWKINTSYDNHQTWLTPWAYYWYDEANWDIIAWILFRAISKNELSYNLINVDYFWNWKDWDLLILDWEIVQIDSSKQYRNIDINSWWQLEIIWDETVILYCLWECIIDWDIICNNKWSGYVKNRFWLIVNTWSWWSWWGWWSWWDSEWWTWWTWWSWWGWYWAGGWWGWWYYSSWWTWWDWWTPWWIGWADWDPWNPWWISAWGWGWTTSGWSWWNAYSYSWWTADDDSSWWGWGWWGWILWNTPMLWLYIYSLSWNWIIKCNWGNWGNWGNWWWSTYDWWGWGWGWGWGWVLWIYWTNNFNWTYEVSWWSWWSWWGWWSWWRNNWVSWNDWTNWTSWEVKEYILYDLI